MSTDLIATILDLQQSDELCPMCHALRWTLTLHVDHPPVDGTQVGDVVVATECIDRSCSESRIEAVQRRLDG